MPVNASPEYYKAYAEYLNANTIEEKIRRLQEVIRLCPKHKSSETLLAHLRSRLSKLKKESEVRKKRGSSSKGIKKTGDAQAIILGIENAGKSSLLSLLTNASPKISELPFTTIRPEIGTLDLDGLKVQTIELPANSSNEWFGIIYGANLILILVNSVKEIINWTKILNEKSIRTKKIFIFNNKNNLNMAELKKIRNLSNITEISVRDKKSIIELKKKIFDNLDLIRVYTKEPGKKKSEIPLILDKDSAIYDMAEKIHKEYPRRFLRAKVWGKSAKFDGQIVGIEHKLKDRDVIELYIK